MTAAREQTDEVREKYDSRILLYARERLQRDKLLEEGEEKWKVVCHALKAIAERRGWKRESITNAFDAALKLSNELGNEKVHQLFTIAHGMHEDMFADVKPIESIQFQIDCADELLHILKREIL